MEKDEYKKRYDYLISYRDVQHRINGLSNELAKWASIGTNINQKYEQGMSGNVGGNSSKTEISGTGLARVKAQIEAEITQAENERDKVKKAVEKVGNRRYRLILTYRFINSMSCKKIADMIGKSERAVYKIIRAAIEQIEIEG